MWKIRVIPGPDLPGPPVPQTDCEADLAPREPSITVIIHAWDALLTYAEGLESEAGGVAVCESSGDQEEDESGDRTGCLAAACAYRNCLGSKDAQASANLPRPCPLASAVVPPCLLASAAEPNNQTANLGVDEMPGRPSRSREPPPPPRGYGGQPETKKSRKGRYYAEYHEPVFEPPPDAP